MIFEFLDICERSVTVVNPYLNRLDWVFPYKWMTKGGVRNSKSTSSDVRKHRPFLVGGSLRTSQTFANITV